MFWGFWILSSWSCQFMKRRRKPTVVQLNSYEPAIVKGGGTWEKPGRKTEDMVFCNLPTTWASKKNRCLAIRGIHPNMKDLHIFPFTRGHPQGYFDIWGVRIRKKWLGRSNGHARTLNQLWMVPFPAWTVHFHDEINERHFRSSRVLLDVFSPEKLL